MTAGILKEASQLERNEVGTKASVLTALLAALIRTPYSLCAQQRTGGFLIEAIRSSLYTTTTREVTAPAEALPTLQLLLAILRNNGILSHLKISPRLIPHGVLSLACPHERLLAN